MFHHLPNNCNNNGNRKTSNTSNGTDKNNVTMVMRFSAICLIGDESDNVSGYIYTNVGKRIR